MNTNEHWQADMPPDAMNSTMQRMRAADARKQRREKIARAIVLGLLALVVIAQWVTS